MGLDEERLYANYQEMAEKESRCEDGIDFVSIATPNEALNGDDWDVPFIEV